MRLRLHSLRSLRAPAAAAAASLAISVVSAAVLTLISATASAATLAEANALWEQRADQPKLEQALAGYEAIANAEPTNREAYLHLLRGWYFLGDGFTDDKDTKIARWTTALEWGDKCLRLNNEYANRLDGGAKQHEAVEALDSDDAPCMYWYSSALGKWGKIQGLSKTLKHLPTVKALMTKVEALNPDYFHFGPARYWGAYYSIIPSFSGRDFDKSAQYFEASLQGAPNYLGTRVLRAENWAVGTQNPKAFVDDLEYVLAADLDSAPDIRPENGKEKLKAQTLLDHIGDYFDKGAIAALNGGATAAPADASTKKKKKKKGKE